MSSHGPYSEGWPMVAHDLYDKHGEHHKFSTQVVPLSDAERLRKALDATVPFLLKLKKITGVRTDHEILDEVRDVLLNPEPASTPQRKNENFADRLHDELLDESP